MSARSSPLLRSTLPETKTKIEEKQVINHFSSKPIPFQSCRLTQFGRSSASRFACSPFLRESEILYLLFFPKSNVTFARRFSGHCLLDVCLGPSIAEVITSWNKKKERKQPRYKSFFFYANLLLFLHYSLASIRHTGYLVVHSHAKVKCLYLLLFPKSNVTLSPISINGAHSETLAKPLSLIHFIAW